MINKKTFVLALGLIVVPLLVLWVLSLGKQNFNSLPYFGEKIAPDGITIHDTVYYKIPPFAFVDQNGDSISIQDFDNYIYVANFFFASCEDVCPMMNAKLATVYEKMGEFSELKFLSITVDPDTDSVPVLNLYAKRFNADAKIWKFALGTPETVFKAGQGFLLPVSIEDKTIDHSQQLLLIDKSRHIRGIYDGLDDTEIKRLKEDIKVLLYDYSQQRSIGKR